MNFVFPPWFSSALNYAKSLSSSNPNIFKIAINLSWIFFDKVLRIIIGLFVGIWVARYLGPSQLGQLNYSISFIAIVTTIATLGLNSVVVVRLIVKPETATITIGSAFFLQCIGSLIAWCIAILAAYIIRPNDQTSLLLITILGISLIFKPSETVRYWFESRVQSKYFVIAEGGAFLIATLLKCALILTSAPLIFFVFLVALEAAISAGFLIYLYSSTTGHLKSWRYKRETANNLLSNCWPIILSGLCVSINMSADKIILREYVSLEELGIYTVASSLVVTWYFLPTAFGGSIAPRLTELYISNKELYFTYARRAYLFFSIGSAALALAICILSTPIIKFLYGSAYAGADQALSIMIWGIVFVSIVSLRGRLLIIETNQKSLFTLVFLGTATNIFLIFCLTPYYGLLGAACSFSISWALNAFIYPLFLSRTKRHGMMALGIKRQYEHN